MSCRTTRAGSVATTFLVSYCDLEDSQATSIFHRLRREGREADITISDHEYLQALNEIEEQIETSPNFAQSNLKARALARLNSAKAENTSEQSIRYAVTRALREGIAAKSLFEVWANAAVDSSDRTSSEIDSYKEFQRLCKEYRKSRQLNPSGTQELVESAASPDIFPSDNATKYAVAVISRRNRCGNCGQFMGLIAHDCPNREASNSVSESSSTGVPQSSQPENREYNFATLSDNVQYDIHADEFTVDIEEFQEIYDSVKPQIASGAPYLLEIPYDAPGGVTARLGAPQGGRSIGLELELDFPDEDYPFFESRHDLASSLYREGLTLSPYIERWHFVGDDRPGGTFRVTPSEWICEFDRSVDPYEGERGIEIKSQIMYDEPETWANLNTICTIANRLGAAPTVRTGLHINMGAQDFSANNPARHNRLLKLAASFDDILVRLAHNPNSSSWHRGRAYCGYASVPPEGFRNVAIARANSNHYQAFNLGHLAAEGESNRISSRIEMRLWDGTSSFPRIQSAVGVSLALVELSKYAINLNQTAQPSGYHRETFGREKLEGDNWTNATESFRKFMGLYKQAGFTSDVHMRNLVAMFAESRWPKRW